MPEAARRRRRRRWRRAAKIAEIALRLGLAAVGSDLFGLGDEIADPPPPLEKEEVTTPPGRVPEEEGHAGP
jgi:hypothetical protein